MTKTAPTTSVRATSDDVAGVVEQRIDGAHVLGDRPVENASDPQAPALQSAPVIAFEEMQAQANQLAVALQERQLGLDERESRLHSQMADFDRQMRAARLWVEEREQDLTDRDAILSKRAADLEMAESERLDAVMKTSREHRDRTDARLAALAAAQLELRVGREQAEKAIALMRQEIDSRREASLQLVRLSLEGLERRRYSLEEMASEIEAQRTQAHQEQMQKARQAQGRETALDRRQAALDARERQLGERERVLTEEHEEVAAFRAQLAEERARDTSLALTRRQRSMNHIRELEEKLEAEREAVTRQSEQLDTRRAALEQLRAELGGLHQQTLEMRLATEELWTQLSGAIPPAALTRALATIRAQLADRYRMEQSNVTERKTEIEALCERLSDQSNTLRAQQQDFSSWMARREEELATQNDELVARQQQLDLREQQLDAARQTWREERLAYQSQTRQLLSELAAA